MRILALTALFILLAGTARAENTTKLFYTCAPWDGQAFAIQVDAPQGHYRLTFWMKGYELLQKGEHSIMLDNGNSGGSDPNVTGRAVLCPSPNSYENCHQHPMTVEFRTLEFRGGGTMEGVIKDGNTEVPFQGTVSKDTVKCG